MKIPQKIPAPPTVLFVVVILLLWLVLMKNYHGL